MATSTRARAESDVPASLDQGLRRELVLGELVDSPHPSQRHGELVAALCWLLRQSAGAPDRARVVASHPVRVGSDPASILISDVSVYLDRPTAGETSSTSQTPGIPAIVFEIVDDWDNAYLWHDRSTLFARLGVAATISVWPSKRRLTMFSPDGTGHDLRAGEQLDLSAIVPGVRFPVAAIFE